MTPWQAANLRLTAFTVSPLKISDPAWWEEIVGQPAETKLQKALVRQETAPFENGKLSLAIHSGRIDWTFNSPDVTGENVEQLPLIGLFPESLEKFSKITHAWLSAKSCPPLKRMAFGAILWQPVTDVKTGYRNMASHLPFVKVDVEGSSDFLYQINRPRMSKRGIPGLKINRLSKWSVGTIKLVGLEAATQQNVASHQETFCSLEMDINTDLEFSGELPQGKLSEIFRELIDLGSEIAEKGDTA